MTNRLYPTQTATVRGRSNIDLQSPHRLRIIIPRKRHTAAIPTPVTVQLANPRRQRQAIHPGRRIIARQRQTDLGRRVARNVLLPRQRVERRRDERTAGDDVRRPVRQRLVEFVHQVDVFAQAAVVPARAATVALAVDAFGCGQTETAGAREEEGEDRRTHG